MDAFDRKDQTFPLSAFALEMGRKTTFSDYFYRIYFRFWEVGQDFKAFTIANFAVSFNSSISVPVFLSHCFLSLFLTIYFLFLSLSLSIMPFLLPTLLSPCLPLSFLLLFSYHFSAPTSFLLFTLVYQSLCLCLCLFHTESFILPNILYILCAYFSLSPISFPLATHISLSLCLFSIFCLSLCCLSLS